MRRIALLIAALCCHLAAADVSVDGYLFGVSRHYTWDGAGRPNSVNRGFGIGATWQPGWLGVSAAGIEYRDSYNRRACAVAAGPRAVLTLDATGAHLSAAVLAGYLDGSDCQGVTAMPVLGAGWRWVSVEGTTNPAEGVVAGWLVVRVPVD